MKEIGYYERLWFGAAAPVLACFIAFFLLDEIKVDNLLNIQFSENFEELKELAELHSVRVLINNHYFDFFFIIAYTVLFVATLKVICIALELKIKKRWMMMCLIPGVLDGFENIAFLSLLDGNAKVYDLYFWLTRAKWAVTIVYLQLVLAILLFYVIANSYRFVMWLTSQRVG